MTFFAKPDQTYEEHIEAVYRAWRQTIKAKLRLIERTAGQYEFSVNRFLRGSLLSIAFHDIGKMIQPFQDMMTCIRQQRPFDKKKNYRHELVSFIYASKYWHRINMGDYLSSIPLEAIAIVGHHRPLDSDLTSFIRESSMSRPAIFPDGINQAVHLAKDLFEREGYVLPSIEIGDTYEEPFKSLAGLFLTALNKGITKNGMERSRAVYAILKAILHYADWHGSGKQGVVYRVSKGSPSLISDIKSRCDIKSIPFSGLTSFQEDCRDKSGHVVAMAPTGSGKTEASILWALKNSQEMGGAKIIYLLPTMVTANSVWNRLTEFFGKKNVGLTHSTANLFLHGDQSLQDEEDLWENRRDVLFDQCFIKPVTVGTVDQLLTIGFNSGRWTLKEANGANAVVIIDEIHAYDDWTLGLIVSTIRHFSRLGARFMVMSATLPEFLRQLLVEELGGGTFIKDDSLSSASRSRYFTVDGMLEDAIEDIKNAFTKGKRVLVVTNTVHSCQNLSGMLSDLRPICYHSQFILRDRKEIEQKIEDASLVVATQVVEVSLDIDFDWLYTECAPPDAMAQRAGRINRYRDSFRDSRVYIFRASEKGEKIYNQVNDPALLARSFEAFGRAPAVMTESDLINIVNQVYAGREVCNSQEFVDAVQQYELSQRNRVMILDSRVRDDKQEVTRQAKYETVSIIPICFREEVLRLKPLERKWYEVKLPLWYVLRNRQEINGISFCDVDYDHHRGAKLKKNDKPDDFIF